MSPVGIRTELVTFDFGTGLENKDPRLNWSDCFMLTATSRCDDVEPGDGPVVKLATRDVDCAKK